MRGPTKVGVLFRISGQNVIFDRAWNLREFYKTPENYYEFTRLCENFIDMQIFVEILNILLALRGNTKNLDKYSAKIPTYLRSLKKILIL